MQGSVNNIKMKKSSVFIAQWGHLTAHQIDCQRIETFLVPGCSGAQCSVCRPDGNSSKMKWPGCERSVILPALLFTLDECGSWRVGRAVVFFFFFN